MHARGALILGHTGFLGSHLAAHLRAQSPEEPLWGLSRRPDAAAAPGLKAIAADMRAPEDLRRALKRLRPRWIFHLAGGQALADPQDLIRDYLIPTANLLKTALELPSPRPRLVLPGSAAEYGLLRRLPATEESLPHPITPYGAIKLAETSLAQVYARRGLEVVVARMFNVLGPGLSPNLSISSFARQIAEIQAGLKPPLLETGDLSPKRDFLDVSDAARALALLARGGRPGGIYNVCAGRSLAIREALKRLIALSGRPVKLKTDPKRLRAADIPDMRGSYRKLHRELGWNPQIPLSETLAAMLAHERRRLPSRGAAGRR